MRLTRSEASSRLPSGVYDELTFEERWIPVKSFRFRGPIPERFMFTHGLCVKEDEVNYFVTPNHDTDISRKPTTPLELYSTDAGILVSKNSYLRTLPYGGFGTKPDAGKIVQFGKDAMILCRLNKWALLNRVI